MTGMPPPSPLRWYNGLQARLVLAFLAVSLIPMMIAADLATQVVVDAFETNIKTWLRETSVYFLNNVRETQKEAASVAEYLVDQDAARQELLSQGKLSPQADSLVRALGYDLVMIYDRDKRILYASQPVSDIQQVPLRSVTSLYRVTLPDRTLIMSAGIRQFEHEGRTLYLLLGIWLDEGFLGTMNAVTSLELRLYYPDNGRFSEIYSSQRIERERLLPQAVADRLAAREKRVYDPEAEGGKYRAMYVALRSIDDEPVGVLFCGLQARETLKGWLTRTHLFLTIFLVGITLSVGAGWLVSKRLAEPLRSLARGVRSIIAGDYRQRVQVQGSDEVAELAGVFNHMAERLGQLHELEAQIRRHDRLSALGEVAVGIAHEVRNPLGIIKTSAELIRRRDNLPPADGKLLAYVIDEVRRIDELIREFLAFARPTPPALTPLAPIQIVERVGAFCQPELERHGIALAIEDKTPGLTVAADENQLYQAFLNLILNAIDAMPEGGRLTIHLRRDGDSLAIDVADTGPGIPAELQERIFNPFFTTKIKGTGLGLAKVFAVMEGHGGQVVCDSAPGRGATFTLSLPLRSSADAAHHSAGR